jgi:hypothetical protein
MTVLRELVFLPAARLTSPRLFRSLAAPCPRGLLPRRFDNSLRFHGRGLAIAQAAIKQERWYCFRAQSQSILPRSDI